MATTLRSPAVLSYVPTPINEYLQEVDTPGGTLTLHVRQWTPKAAAMCRKCADCVREDGPNGRTVCVLAWEGRQTAGSIARLESERLARALANRTNNSAGWWNDEGVRPLIHEAREHLGESQLCGD